MDFFRQQELAHKRSKLLIVLFAMAVIGVALVTHVFMWYLVHLGTLGAWPSRHRDLLPFTITIVLVLVLAASARRIRLLRRDGGAEIAERLGGSELSRKGETIQDQRLLNVVEEMAIASGVPVPRVYKLNEEDGVNAFAAGHTPRDAVIGVTRGAVESLRRDELQGIIAHEFSHILNGDMLLNLRAVGILHGIFSLIALGRAIYAASARSDSASNSGSAILLGRMLIAAGSVGMFFGRLVQSAISRQRETLADASAVQFTRDTHGLSSTLKRIGKPGIGSQVKSVEVEGARHLFFAQPTEAFVRFGRFFRTHPPLEERILALEPGWDGRFEAAVSSEHDDRGFTTPPSLVEGSVVFLQEGSAAAVSAGLEHIGQPRQQEIVRAREIHAGLPREWLDAAHDPVAAQTLTIGLLLSYDPDAREAHLRRLGESATPETAELASRFAIEADTRSDAEKVATMEIATAALRTLEEDALGGFLRRIEEIAEVGVGLPAYMMSRILRCNLESSFEGARPLRIRNWSLRKLLEDAEVILSAVSKACSASESEALEIFSAGVSALNAGRVNLRFRVGPVPGWESLDYALGRYERASPQLKKQLIDACAAVVLSTPTVTERDLELLRLIGDTIGCPVPPFVYH